MMTGNDPDGDAAASERKIVESNLRRERIFRPGGCGEKGVARALDRVEGKELHQRGGRSKLSEYPACRYEFALTGPLKRTEGKLECSR
jgi:hypothetical protein